MSATPCYALPHRCPVTVGLGCYARSWWGAWWSRQGPPLKSTVWKSQPGTEPVTYLKPTDNEQCVDAVGTHLCSNVFQVFPGENPENSSGEMRPDRLTGWTKHHQHPDYHLPWLQLALGQFVGEQPTAGMASEQVPKKCIFKRKEGEASQLSSSFTSTELCSLIRKNTP